MDTQKSAVEELLKTDEGVAYLRKRLAEVETQRLEEGKLIAGKYVSWGHKSLCDQYDRETDEDLREYARREANNFRRNYNHAKNLPVGEGFIKCRDWRTFEDYVDFRIKNRETFEIGQTTAQILQRLWDENYFFEDKNTEKSDHEYLVEKYAHRA